MKQTNELALRKAVWKELKRFIKVGTEAVLLEDTIDVLYDTRELSILLEKILVLVKKYPLPFSPNQNRRTIKTPPKPRPSSLADIKETVKKAPPKRVTARALRDKTYNVGVWIDQDT